MTDKEKETIKEFDRLIKLRKNKAGEIKFDTCIVSTAQLETVVNLIQTQQAEIEYYKKQKIYDEQFKHELLEEIRCKGLTIDSLNKILDDRLICIQGGRGLYAKLKGLDKEYLIREYLSMYKMCKAEIEKKDKTIDLMSEEIAKTDDDLCEYIDQTTKNNNCRAEEDCINCIKQYFERKVENGN